MSKLSFDASKVKPQEALDPIPSNWYPAVVTESELKPTPGKNGAKAGKRLALVWTIIEGEYKGRKIFDGYNIENANPVAQEIGQGQLSALCLATKTPKFSDTKELHDKPHEVKVGFESARVDEKTKENYDARNVVKGTRPLEGAAATPGGGATARPWEKDKKVTPPPTPTAEETPAAEEPAKVWQPNDGVEETTLFWFGDPVVEKTAAELLAGLNDGTLNAESNAMLQSEEDWKLLGDYFTLTAVEAEEKVAPAKPTAPKKPTAPAKPTATEAAKKNTPPWRKGK